MLLNTINNLSNYASYIQLMLMTPKFSKKLRGLAIGYENKTNTDTTNILREDETSALHLVALALVKRTRRISHTNLKCLDFYLLYVK